MSRPHIHVYWSGSTNNYIPFNDFNNSYFPEVDRFLWFREGKINDDIRWTTFHLSIFQFASVNLENSRKQRYAWRDSTTLLRTLRWLSQIANILRRHACGKSSEPPQICKTHVDRQTELGSTKRDLFVIPMTG